MPCLNKNEQVSNEELTILFSKSASMVLQHQQSSAVRTVGLAFLPKKLPRVLTLETRDLAVAAGLQLVVLEPHRPLHEQQAALPGPAACCRSGATGPTFDIILHKLHADPVWEAHLEQYVASHPGVRVLDSPNAIQNTEDRAVMLAAIPPAGLLLRLPGPTPQAQQNLNPDLHPISGPGSRTGLVAGDALNEERTWEPEEAPTWTSVTSDTAVMPPPHGSRGCGGRLVSVRRPPQVVVQSRKALHALATCDGGVRPAGLRPPLILKTQRTDAVGGNGHGLAIALTWSDLIQKGEALQGTASATAAATNASGAAIASGLGASGGGSGNGNGGRARDVRDNNDGGDGDGDCEYDGWVPLVIQQYVPHEEALYKVYVLGQYVRVERRDSLTLQQLSALQIPQPLPPALANQSGSQQQLDADSDYLAHAATDTATVQLLQNLSAQPQSQRSLKPQQRHAAHSGSRSTVESREAGWETAGDPGLGKAAAASGSTGCLDISVLEVVARELSRRMDLTMFNFDVVAPVLGLSVVGEAAEPARETGEVSSGVTLGALGEDGSNDAGDAGNRIGDDACVMYVVDVNYFPGYDKLPGWEAHLVAHLRAVADGLAARS
ncbi:hypothetical protein VaNZ11_012306 [Volvox africanus]|uniref:Inositol-1,3,4-trisphosphate 5/6-kinase n=1 Tax=Volvox africanus TaxID=51714 RepID=A0ABQ5SFJ9_9CHLO|nr:hypothetical protein VaNZ11_012306 [Volvox africanus]